MIDDDLAAIRDEMDKTVGDGRDIDTARTLADTYVDAHPELFAFLSGMSIEALVASIDVYRAEGMEQEQWLVETWLLHRFDPQNIGGPVEAKVRITNG